MINGIGIVTTSTNVGVSSQTLDQCLKATSQLTRTVYQNICTGEVYAVPLGFWDYLIVGGVAVFILLLISVFLLKVIFD